MNKAFTLIELVVVITIIVILSTMVLYVTIQYVDKGKDSNIASNLAVLVPAGEVWYNGAGNSYVDFCNPNQNSVIKNVLAQMPEFTYTSPSCSVGATPGVCCNVAVSKQAWAACAKKFTDGSKAFCVDSRGMKKDINSALCIANTLTQCP